MKNEVEIMLMVVFSMFIIMGLIFVIVGIYDAGPIFSFVGGVFTIVGCSAIGSMLYRRHIQKKVKETGIVIYTDIVDVVLEHTKVNNIQGYRVRTQWLDVSTNTLYLFQSNYISKDPTDKIKNLQKIRVMVNPSNYAQYDMDISFLYVG